MKGYIAVLFESLILLEWQEFFPSLAKEGLLSSAESNHPGALRHPSLTKEGNSGWPPLRVYSPLG